MAATGEREEQARALRIVSKCSSVDEFVSIFRRFCDEKSLFVVTKRPKSLGAKPHFTITLADGAPMLKGVGTVVESYPDRHNSFGRPGMKLRFDDLDPHSQEILRRLNQARKSKKNTPPPLPRHMRPKSEGEPVPPASPELKGLGDSDALDQEDATQVDAEPLAEVVQAAAKEERRKGSDFVLPANPFGELTDASLEAFVECTLYEETGTFEHGFGEGSEGAPDHDGRAEAGAASDEQPPDAGQRGGATPAGDRDEAAAEGAPVLAPSRPITVPISIPPIREASPEKRAPSPAASPLARALDSAKQKASEARSAEAGAPSTDDGWIESQPIGAPAQGRGQSSGGVVGALIADTLSTAPPEQQAVPVQPAPDPWQRPDLTPPPQPAAMAHITEPVMIGGLQRRAWTAKHLMLAGGGTLILGLVVGYILWGTDKGSSPAGDGNGARSVASSEARSPADAGAAQIERLTAGQGSPNQDPGSEDAGAGGDVAEVAVAGDPGAVGDPGAAAEDGEGVPDEPAAGGNEQLDDPSACAVELITEPEGALAVAGGQRLGETPYVGDLPCDVDSVQIAHPRYENIRQEIAPVPGERIKIELKLQRPTVALRITSSPSGASVTVGGRRVGTTPATVKVRGFERTTVQVSKRGYKTQSQQVYPKKASTPVNVTLAKVKARSRSTRKKTPR